MTPPAARSIRFSGAAALLALVAGACAVAEPLPSSDIAHWEAAAPAPFTRHEHEATAHEGRLLVMGNRAGVSVAEPVGEDAAGEAVLTLEVVGEEFEFSPSTVQVPIGEPVRIVLRNEGLIEHDLVVQEAGVYLRADPGQTVETVAVFEGPVTFFCSIPGHAEAGMVGQVEAAGGGEAEQAPIELGAGGDLGFHQMWWYDPTADEWTRAADLPHSFDHVELVSHGDLIYSIGGFFGNTGEGVRDDVFAYDPSEDSWRRVASLPTPRGSMACASGGSRIYCTGGRSEPEGTPSATDLFAYDADADAWEVLPEPLPTPRDHVGAAVVDGVLWVIGGRGTGERKTPTGATEGYVIETGEWITGANLPTPQSAGGLGVIDGKIVAFGGEGPVPGAAGAAGRNFMVFEDVSMYDPGTDRWVRLDPMPTPVHAMAYAQVDGQVHSIGGGVVSGASASDLHQVLVFDS